jgi:hypothetical protein
MEFIRILDLLETGVPHGAIATAIENKGYVWGWDRFGRYKKFIKDKKGVPSEYLEVLDALAADYKWFAYPREDEQAMDREAAFGEFPKLGAYGWPESENIDFDIYVIADQDAPVRATYSGKENDNNLRILGALRECLVGADRAAFIEECTTLNNSNLIAFLEKRYAGFGGLRPRNLEEKFSRAKKLLEDF